MSNLIIKNTPIENLKIIKHQVNKDERGFLSRLFCQKTLSHLIKGKIICQINKTLTLKKGAIRGLHFQYPPYAETKIISCLEYFEISSSNQTPKWAPITTKPKSFT